MEAIGSNIRTGQPLAVVMGAGGLAMAVARRLADVHRVVLVDRDGEHLERQVAALNNEGHHASGVVADVSDEGDVRAAADAAAALGPVRSLAHVVGLSPSLGDAATLMRVNLRGPALVADAFLPVMGPGGASVFISSIAGHLGIPVDPVVPLLDDPLAPDLVERVRAAVGDYTSADAYRFSKVGLMRLVRRLAPAWGARGLRINSLSPGIIATPMGAREFANPAKLALYEKTPLGREGTMIEIADAIEFLLSDRASFVSGTDLLVDGGVVAAVATGA